MTKPNECEECKLLKKLLKVAVEMLPKHSPDCYGLQVHSTNTMEYCNCNMREFRKSIRTIKE